MQTSFDSANDLYFLQGGGEMGELIRVTDWGKTPLGEPGTWPPALRTMVGVMLDNPFGMYIAWGPEYTQLYNDGYRPILGATKHPQALGIGTRETFSEIWHIIGSMFEGVRQGKAVGFPDFMLPLNRYGFVEECYFDFSYSPIRTDDGKVGGVLVTVIETTNKKRAEDALRESEVRFRAMADNIPNLAWMSGADGVVKWYNKKWYEYTGTTMEQMDGVGWQLFHDPEKIDAVVTQWEGSLENGEAFEMEVPLKGADGRFRQFLTRGLPIYDGAGNIEQWFGTCTDITERVQAEEALKKSENNLRNTILQAPVAMCIFKGPQHVVELANERMVELWGKTMADVHLKPIFVGLPEAKDQGFEELLDHVLSSGETHAAEGVPITLPRNGHIQNVFVNFVYAPHRRADGTIKGVIALASDVTAQVQAKQEIEELVRSRTSELADANGSLQASNAELAQFAYIASHDLQEPVRKVSTYIQMLEHSLGAIDERSLSYLHKINDSTSRMLILIRDVLAYSQLSRKKEIFELVDLDKIVENIKGDFELLLEQKDAVIECHNLPVIEAIPQQMSQLFGNLISNALKFVRPGVKPVITISSTLLTDPPFGYRIECRDNGIGFKKEYSEQIFDIFQRLHDRTEYTGTGIGLAICKRIVQNHQGEICAKGEVNQGAVFEIRLPAKRADFE
jgi:PAS domain S-box-containing protein